MEQEGFHGGREGFVGGSACGRNRMTERAHGTVGGDDCQNRAARRYEKCSYLWHYFRRFEPFFRPDPSPLPARLANRSPVPLFPLLPYRYLLTPALNLLLRSPTASFRRTRVVLTSSPRSPPRISSPLDYPTLRRVGGPTTTNGRAQRGDSAPTAAGTTLMLH